MTQSVYLVGGAGVGKSTFMGQLMDELALRYEPIEDLHARPNKKAVVTLRGHRLRTYDGKKGLYLGCLRDSFPGTDGLDRASSPTGEEWLQNGSLPEFIIAEGATLATRRFIAALDEETNLLLVHLVCTEKEWARRIEERGAGQKESFLKATATRSLNLVNYMPTMSKVLTVETSSDMDWNLSLDICRSHLRNPD